MKKYYIGFILFLSFYCSAQQRIAYTYDLSGNRVNRHYFPMRMANPSLEVDSSAIVEKKFGISVFPNPAPDKINVGITALEDGETAKVYLSDDQGKVLLMREQTSKLGTLELGNLKAGIYYIKVYIKTESVSYKIVKL